jgi:succinylglutamic semialdehyde dehydrogenase
MHYINGQWIEGKGEALVTHDPTTGNIGWQYHAAEAKQIHTAISSARNALTYWSALSLESRIEVLQQYANELQQRQTALATIISEETGKPLWDAQTEITAMINKVAISIDAYQARTSTTQSIISDEIILTTQHRPLGVFAVLGPLIFLHTYLMVILYLLY